MNWHQCDAWDRIVRLCANPAARRIDVSSRVRREAILAVARILRWHYFPSPGLWAVYDHPDGGRREVLIARHGELPEPAVVARAALEPHRERCTTGILDRFEAWREQSVARYWQTVPVGTDIYLLTPSADEVVRWVFDELAQAGGEAGCGEPANGAEQPSDQEVRPWAR